MPGDDLDLSIRIRAENAASLTFREVERDADRTGQTLRQSGEHGARGAELTSRGLRDVIQAAKVTTGTIASEIHPAFGRLVFAISSASREGVKFSLTTSGMLIGLAILDETIGKFIANARQAAQTQAELNQALRELDASAIRAKLQGLVKEMDTFNEQLRIATDPSRKILERYGASMTALFKSLLLKFRDTAREFEDIQKALEAGPAAFQRQGRLVEATIRQQQGLVELSQTQAAIALKEFSAPAFIEAVENAATAMRAQLQAERDKLIRQAEQQKRKAPDQATAIEKALGLDFEGLEDRFRARFAQLGVTLREGRLELDRQADIFQSRGRLLSAQSQSLAISREQKDALMAQGIELDRLLTKEQLRGKHHEEELSLLNEQVAAQRQANLELERLARTNPLEGLQLGLQIVADEFKQVGTLMQNAARATAQGMAQAYSDFFFNVITGEFKKLQDLPRQLGQAVFREISNVLGQVTIGAAFQGFRR